MCTKYMQIFNICKYSYIDVLKSLTGNRTLKPTDPLGSKKDSHLCSNLAFPFKSCISVQILHFRSNPAFPQNVSELDSRVTDIQFQNAQILLKRPFSFDSFLLLLFPRAHHCLTSSSVKLVQFSDASKQSDQIDHGSSIERIILCCKQKFLKAKYILNSWLFKAATIKKSSPPSWLLELKSSRIYQVRAQAKRDAN